jgi:hypothetical protein
MRNLFIFWYFRERISKTEQLRQQLRASELYDSVQLHTAKGKKPPELEFFKKSMRARHRGGIGFSYRPARLHRLAEFIPWNQCRGPINI